MFFNKKMSLIAVFCFLGNQLLIAQKATQIMIIEHELERRENLRNEFMSSMRSSTRTADMIFLAGCLSIFACAYCHDLSFIGCSAAAVIGALGWKKYQSNRDDKRCIEENPAYFQEELVKLEKFCQENEVILSYVNASEADKEKIRNSMNKIKEDWRNHLENSKKK
ncbi:MAG TPA: hypothetical protein VHO47_03660 [Candidatus Babeliales bacterium]|nr:hypothetical protein [Candidatus Babeliales bacterium]